MSGESFGSAGVQSLRDSGDLAHPLVPWLAHLVRDGLSGSSLISFTINGNDSPAWPPKCVVQCAFWRSSPNPTYPAPSPARRNVLLQPPACGFVGVCFGTPHVRGAIGSHRRARRPFTTASGREAASPSPTGGSSSSVVVAPLVGCRRGIDTDRTRTSGFGPLPSPGLLTRAGFTRPGPGRRRSRTTTRRRSRSRCRPRSCRRRC